MRLYMALFPRYDWAATLNLTLLTLCGQTIDVLPVVLVVVAQCPSTIRVGTSSCLPPAWRTCFDARADGDHQFQAELQRAQHSPMEP